MTENEAKEQYWWLKKDCRKCKSHPDCPFVEIKSATPRGCSLYEEFLKGEIGVPERRDK